MAAAYNVNEVTAHRV